MLEVDSDKKRKRLKASYLMQMKNLTPEQVLELPFFEQYCGDLKLKLEPQMAKPTPMTSLQDLS